MTRVIWFEASRPRAMFHSEGHDGYTDRRVGGNVVLNRRWKVSEDDQVIRKMKDMFRVAFCGPKDHGTTGQARDGG